MFVGRWQPFHLGHRWLIDRKLKSNIPVLICVRDIDPNEENPLTSSEVVLMLNDVFKKEIKERVIKIIVIPDIESFNYGRGVGYEIREHKPPDNVKTISGTEIRNKIRSNDNSWKEFVDSNAVKWLENNYK